MDPEPPAAPRLRAPRSSLAVGRRFRLLARSPLLGAGQRPRVPTGFVALSRDGAGAPESENEKVLVLPSHDNGRSRDVAWSEARWAADMAAEDALLVAMMLPTETAPERKQEAHRLHDRALKLYLRLDALGPGGVEDPRSLAADVRLEVQAVTTFLRSCQLAQEEGTLQSLAWPFLLDFLRQGLDDTLARLDGAAALASPPSVEAWARQECPRLAVLLRLAARHLDPSEEARITHMRDLARALLEVDPAGEATAVQEAVAKVVAEMTQLARDVESAGVRSILTPLSADHFRREAARALHDLERVRTAASRTAW